jgi:hypothetical protein
MQRPGGASGPWQGGVTLSATTDLNCDVCLGAARTCCCLTPAGEHLKLCSACAQGLPHLAMRAGCVLCDPGLRHDAALRESAAPRPPQMVRRAPRPPPRKGPFAWVRALASRAEAALAQGDVPRLVAALASPDAARATDAARALQRLAHDPSFHGALHRSGATPALVAVLRAGSPAAQRAAADALAQLAAHSAEARDAAVRSGACTSLVELLAAPQSGPESDSLCCACCTALAALCVESGSQSELAAAGASRVLVRLVLRWEASPAVALAALRATHALCADHAANKAAVGAAGGVAALMPLLSSGAGAEAAACLLEVLCRGCAANRSAALHGGALAALTRALSGECGGSAARALGVVVTGVPDAQAAAVAAGAVPLLAALLVRGDPGACEGAVAALRSLTTRFTPAVDALVVCQGVPPLVALLRSGQLCETACCVLRNVAALPAHRAHVVAVGAVPPLVDLLERGSVSATSAAAAALTNLAADVQSHKRAVVRAGALRPLASALRSAGAGTEAVRGAAAGCVGNLVSGCGEHAEQALLLGVLDPLCAMTASAMYCGADGQAAAARALRSLVAGSRPRAEQAVRGGAIEALLAAAAKGSSAAVRETALRVLAALLQLGSFSHRALASGAADALTALAQDGAAPAVADAAASVLALLSDDANLTPSVRASLAAAASERMPGHRRGATPEDAMAASPLYGRSEAGDAVAEQYDGGAALWGRDPDREHRLPEPHAPASGRLAAAQQAVMRPRVLWPLAMLLLASGWLGCAAACFFALFLTTRNAARDQAAKLM